MALRAAAAAAAWMESRHRRAIAGRLARRQAGRLVGEQASRLTARDLQLARRARDRHRRAGVGEMGDAVAAAADPAASELAVALQVVHQRRREPVRRQRRGAAACGAPGSLHRALRRLRHQQDQGSHSGDDRTVRRSRRLRRRPRAECGGGVDLGVVSAFTGAAPRMDARSRTPNTRCHHPRNV